MFTIIKGIGIITGFTVMTLCWINPWWWWWGLTRPLSIYEEVKIIFTSTVAALMGDILFSKLLTFLLFFSMNKILWMKVGNLFHGYFSFQHGIFKIKCFLDTKMLNLPWSYNTISPCLYDCLTKKQQLLGWNLEHHRDYCLYILK